MLVRHEGMVNSGVWIVLMVGREIAKKGARVDLPLQCYRHFAHLWLIIVI